MAQNSLSRLAIWLAAGVLWIVHVSPVMGMERQQASPTPKAAARGKAAPAPPAKSKSSAPPTPAVQKLIDAADAARQAERWDEAAALYGKVVAAKPDYVAGYWYQGAALYSLDEFAKCRDAFRKTVRLAPGNGAAFAFLGLCEFGVKEYDRALRDLMQSRTLGTGDAGDIGNVARYHAAILMARAEQYEQALETLGEFAAQGDDNPRVIEALGIATVRLPMLPAELPPDRREMVLMAGRASYLMATRNTASAGTAFKALVSRYPETPNVHYAYAVFLLQEEPDAAIAEFNRELEIQPGHPWSMMQMAFEYLKRGDAPAALPWAQKAVAGVPDAYPARRALGQALLDTGDVAGAITEFQAGLALQPESPGLHFQLARAYQRAGRTEDAARERDEFTRLDRLSRTQRTGAQSVGGR